jgi:hypothetical protein
MARNLSIQQETLLSNSQYIVEELVEVYTALGVNYYWTTGPYNITTSTTTSGGNRLFTPNNSLNVITNLTESYQLNSGGISLTLGNLDNSEIAGSPPTPGVITTLTTRYTKNRVVVYKMFRNATTLEAVTSDLIQIYDGTVTSVNIDTSESSQTISMECSSIFRALDKVSGRTNTDLAPQEGGTLFWGGIYVE